MILENNTLEIKCIKRNNPDTRQPVQVWYNG